MKIQLKYNIKFNLEDPSAEVKLDMGIFKSRDYKSQYPNSIDDKDRQNFPFDNKTKNWEIEIFKIEPKFVQGFIRINTINNVSVVDFFNKESKIILVEFIHANYKVSANLAFRWKSSFYPKMPGRNQRQIDKMIPLIYEEVRKWERIQNKIKSQTS